MAKRKVTEPAPGFSAAPGEKSRYSDHRGQVIITHPYWNGYDDCSCDFDTPVTLAEAEALHAELGEAIAAARAAVRQRQEALREAAGRAIDAELDKILPRHG